jgi:hypothetical protein
VDRNVVLCLAVRRGQSPRWYRRADVGA